MTLRIRGIFSPSKFWLKISVWIWSRFIKAGFLHLSLEAFQEFSYVEVADLCEFSGTEAVGMRAFQESFGIL
jgi:hypothetical protein